MRLLQRRSVVLHWTVLCFALGLVAEVAVRL